MTRTQMPVRAAAVAVRGTEFDADQIELPVPNPSLGDDGVGKLPYPLHRSLEQSTFDALFVVEVSMHRRDGEIVVGVLDLSQPFGELPFVMVVDVREIRDADPLEVALNQVLLEVRPQHIPDGFAPGGIAAVPDQSVERGGE